MDATKKWLQKRGAMRFEERKLGRGMFSGLAAFGDQVNETFAMCHAEG